MCKNTLIKMIAVISLAVGILTGCGKEDLKAERTIGAQEAAETTEEPRSGAIETIMDDAMSTSSEDDKEFIIIRIKDDYYDIRRRNEYLRLHNLYTDGADYPEIEDGTCARVVADVNIVNGGIAGYQNDYFLKDVKSCVPLTYDEVAQELELNDAGDTNIDMYNHVLIYHHKGSSYLICVYQDKVEAYKDGKFYAEYVDEDIEWLDTPEPFLNSL
ncbi:MAG: hypothetical protein K6B44_14165 [Lachnospiraceae bacterium]|nr:hypothetical protein [Lachnospiraceae bacterium]